MNMTASAPLASRSRSISGSSPFPFALLTFPLTRNPAKGISTARRAAGEPSGAGTLRVADTMIELSGNQPQHLAALTRACTLLPGQLDGEYPVAWYANHRAPVEAEEGAIAVDTAPLADGQRDVLALAWAVALIAAKTGDRRAALQAAVALYRALSAAEQTAVHKALDDGTLDAGYLASIFLTRSARETSPDEMERWESWFMGQQRVDLPYDRRAVVAILEAEDIDPDEKRLLIHDVVAGFDAEMERQNIKRIVSEVRAQQQELVFGRMSRAFHNQSLLFANAGYVLVNDAIRDRVSELVLACAGSALLAPPADRLRTIIQGARETPRAAALGAVELLEDAILDEQRKQIDGVLKAGREGQTTKSKVSSGDILARTEKLLALCGQFRDALLAAPNRPAAFVLLSQRIFPLESHLMARINELQEPYLGKPDNLKMLARKGGHRMYSSADYSWLQHADHWVEAIPLFIKERVLVVDGVEVTETVIDQAVMEETFREQFADHWALGIDNVMDSEHVALARELLARDDERLGGDDRTRAAATEALGLQDAVGALAAMIAFGYRTHAELVHLKVEQDGTSRYDTMRAILTHNIATDHPQCLGAEIARRAKANGTAWTAEALTLLSELDAPVREEAARLAEIAGLPCRQLPSLHVLTTQSARMSDSYVRTWLEESMAMFNVIRAHKLEQEVRDRQVRYRTQVSALGAGLIRDLGMWAEVEELMAVENLPEGAAVARIVFGNATIFQQVSILAVLAEHYGLPTGSEPALVEELLIQRADALQAEALRAVFERNELELLPKMDAYKLAHPTADEMEVIRALILDNPDYTDDVVSFTRFAAREEAVRELDRADAGLQLAARARDWMRNHTRLSLTTARRETLLAHGLGHLTLHPLYYYRAAGGNKRFHQLYTPSRVDLGTHERESVEKWSQWVGGADREACRVGRRTYGLINKNPKMFDSLTEPEVIKTGENASMVAIFSYSNAMSLLVNSVGRGDVEDLGDQMSLRKDRMIRPGGEGYGGYCVPKDGLFLEFVLILTRATKLRQLGIPDNLHAGVVAMAKDLIARRADFATEVEWEAHAMRMLAARAEVNPYFDLRESKDGPVPVFQITRIAQALTQLGRPELTDSFDVLANLAARWGIHKIIVGGEQVNRFMAFYKVWLTYRAMEDAQRLNPNVPVKVKDFTVVLSAEYKPDTQDGRFSIGMRKYEMFAGTGEHLTYSLDVPGQDLVHLMFHGFDHLWQNRTDPRLRARLTRLLAELQVQEHDAASIGRLREMYPGYTAPSEIRMVSPMMLTTSDLLHYTSDTHLEQLATEVQRRLLNEGLTEDEITANMQVYGPRLENWTKLRDLPADHLRTLISRIGGNIHALALSIIGPAGNYEMSVQGADVLDTGIPHTALLALLEDPIKLRELMLEGNPNSALVIVDGASGARHRAMNKMAVMRWFATGEAIGRQSIYRCVGIGNDTIEDWRTDMRYQRARARGLFDALVAGNAEEARERYTGILHDLRDEQETALTLEAEERMLRFGKRTPQEEAVARALANVTAGLSLEQLDFGTWLALGGQYWLMGATAAQLAHVRASFEQGITALGGTAVADEEMVKALYAPAFIPAVEEFREEKGIESSNKATEEVAAVAIDTRKRLAERAARAKAMSERKQAFDAVMARYADALPTVEALVAEARLVRGDGTTMTQVIYGQMQALTRLALLTLGRELFADEPSNLELLTSHLDAALYGQILDPFFCRPIVGGYEDIGDIARLGNVPAEAFHAGKIDQTERDRQLGRLADVAELFDNCKAIGLTIDFFWLESDAYTVWRAMADFFAESLNDHLYEYRPWVYARGIGFKHLVGEAFYQLAVDHHRWLYSFLRNLALTYTELGQFSQDDLAQLLGDMDTADVNPPIGCDAEIAVERQWRAYNQLRELAFIRNDGFPLPEVFPVFDPEIIDAAKRVNLFYMYPMGRTHISRAIMEGPTLTAELVAEGKRGVNLLVARDACIATPDTTTRPVVQAYNAQLYISRAEYITALTRHRGLTMQQAEAVADAKCDPKGIRVVARFTGSVTISLIFPFHGHPKYESGKLEAMGLPYSSQSLFHTWTTYDKAKYPDIFCTETGVELPGEIDWLAADTEALGEAATRQALEFGDSTRNFPGLREFGKRYRRIMVKDAAESGGRGQKAFNLRTADGALDLEAVADAVDFAYQITQRHNVAIQEVIISSPEYWATEEFLRSFVDRQVQEWGAVVNRTKRPRTSIYGSHRLIFSSDNPLNGEWHISHPITLNSRQLITNVGRGGTLELFRVDHIRPEYREQLWSKLVEAGKKTMNALARYGTVAAEEYRKETDCEIGQDATGLSYAVPRYMMLDFLVQPIFADEGVLVDLEPTYDASGVRNGVRFILQQDDRRIVTSVKDWRVVLIEPNIGIGLWDRVAVREEFHHVRAAATPDWHAVGANARIVLRDYASAAGDYLDAITK